MKRYAITLMNGYDSKTFTVQASTPAGALLRVLGLPETAHFQRADVARIDLEVEDTGSEAGE